MSKFTLYTKESCPQCDSMKGLLFAHDIQYDMVNTTEKPEGLEKVKEMGYMSFPVLINNETGKSCSGFNPPQAFGVLGID